MAKERRAFLGACLGALLAAGAGAAAYPVFRYLAPRQKADNGQKVEIPESELTAGSAKYFEYQGKAAVLIRKKNGDLVALSAVCTHLGCVVQWQKANEQFLCPCHGGLYTADGTVISGPPPKPLEKLSFVVANGKIIVG